MTLPLRVTAAGRRPLASKGQIGIVPLITFTPAHGTPNALYRRVTLRLTKR